MHATSSHFIVSLLEMHQLHGLRQATLENALDRRSLLATDPVSALLRSCASSNKATDFALLMICSHEPGCAVPASRLNVYSLDTEDVEFSIPPVKEGKSEPM